MRAHVFFCVAVVCVFLLLGGCGNEQTTTSSGAPGPAPGPGGGGGPQTTQSAFLYCAENSHSTIFAARIDPNTGAVTLVNSAMMGTPGSTATIRVAAHPNGQCVYASDTAFSSAGSMQGTPGIGEFRVDRSTGAISPLPGSPLLTAQRGDELPGLDHRGRAGGHQPGWPLSFPAPSRDDRGGRGRCH